MLHSLYRPTFSALLDFPIGNIHSRNSAKRRSQHRQTQMRRSPRLLRFQRRLRSGNENQFVQPQRFLRMHCQLAMRSMHRVETPAENPDTQTPKKRFALFRYGIKSARRKRIAPQNTPHGKRAPDKKSVFQQRLSRELRTRRRKPATAAPARKKMNYRRNEFAVNRDSGESEINSGTLKKCVHSLLPFLATRETTRRAASK